MDYGKEISFGAFDSELMHQEIYIPEGFEATIDGDKIILTRKESKDERISKKIKKVLNWYRKSFSEKSLRNEEYDEMFAWLVKQGEKPQRMISAEAKEALYDKHAWSEEDEEMFRSIKATCELAEQERDSSPARHLLEMQLNWLKSLKERYTWKPSDKQMHAFEQVYDWYNNNFAPSETLTSLYKDLEKLKGE